MPDRPDSFYDEKPVLVEKGREMGVDRDFSKAFIVTSHKTLMEWINEQ